MGHGSPVRGILHSTDASAGVALTLYPSGGNTALTLAANEILEIETVDIISAPGGDVKVFVAADMTLTAGNTVVRGTVAANGGIVKEFKQPWAGSVGHTPRAIAPAGVLDVIITGAIVNGRTRGQRPNWREDEKGQ